jgi:hypothetical protein|tara:strand:- start:754 stop:864 length:111 start_codon:yes stop_codon:yes gene_type:complete
MLLLLVAEVDQELLMVHLDKQVVAVVLVVLELTYQG